MKLTRSLVVALLVAFPALSFASEGTISAKNGNSDTAGEQSTHTVDHVLAKLTRTRELLNEQPMLMDGGRQLLQKPEYMRKAKKLGEFGGRRLQQKDLKKAKKKNRRVLKKEKKLIGRRVQKKEKKLIGRRVQKKAKKIFGRRLLQ